MAKNDIKFKDAGVTLKAVEWQTEANATAILGGEPVKLKATGSPYVIPLADAEPVIGTTTRVVGIAAGPSSQTASADGTVMVYELDPTMVLRAKAKTAASVNTASEIAALCGDNKLMDLTSSVYTVDEAAANAAANGIVIIGGDPVTQELYFQFRASALSGPIA